MRKVLGLAATATAATLGIGGAETAQASVYVGTVSVWRDTANTPWIAVRNSSGTSWQNVRLRMHDSKGNFSATLAFALNDLATANYSLTIAPFAIASASNTKLTPNATFSVVANAATGSQTYVSTKSFSGSTPNWLDFGGTAGGAEKHLAANIIQASVPEPATLALLSVGLIGLGATRRRRV